MYTPWNAPPGYYPWEINEWDELPPEEEPGCVICGGRVKRGERYCGASCQRMDEEGLL